MERIGGNQDRKGRCKEWNQTNVDIDGKCWREGDRCIAIGKKKDNTRGGWTELVLLLLRPPSPLLAGPLEVFQRSLLYLIKASQAPGKAPRPAIFLHFLQTWAGILKDTVKIKAGMQNWNREFKVLHSCSSLLWLLGLLKKKNRREKKIIIWCSFSNLPIPKYTR